MLKNPFDYSAEEISQIARRLRIKDLKMTSKARIGHLGADFSEMEILCALYFSKLRYDINNLENPERDYFILSKGHGSGGYYCVLNEAGLLADEDLDDYMQFKTRTPGHPCRHSTPGVEFSTGSLGHGVPVAAGIAYALTQKGKANKVYVLSGDGELQEGAIWEAAMFIGNHNLANLCWIIDRNRFQLGGATESIANIEPLADKLHAFGLEVIETDGQSICAILKALSDCNGKTKATAIIANTSKGAGVSFMENQAAWHHRIPSESELRQAVNELEEGINV